MTDYCTCLVPGVPEPVTVHDTPGGVEQVIDYLCSVCHQPIRDDEPGGRPDWIPAPPLTGVALWLARVGYVAATGAWIALVTVTAVAFVAALIVAVIG